MPEFSQEQLEGYLATAIELTLSYVPKLLLAVLVLVVGLWFIRRINSLIQLALVKSDTDPALTSFLQSISSVVLKVLLIISVASMIGIATTSFVAMLGAAGLALGLALQGSLSNFAGGVLILFFKPFRLGDFIEAQGITGTVKSIQIFNTVLNTTDNKVVIVPNGPLSNGIITNYSRERTRRIEIFFGIGYDDNMEAAKQIIRDAIAAEDRIHKDPEPLVAVAELADSSVNIITRVWVDSGNLSAVRFALTETVKARFDDAGISIPYPQSDVHLHQV